MRQNGRHIYRVGFPALAFVLLATLLDGRPARADCSGWTDRTPSVVLNWESFTAQGIPSWWRPRVEDLIKTAITRWHNVGGANLRPHYDGLTTDTTAGAGTILIRMNEAHGEPRLASAFNFCSNRCEVVFHRKDTAGGTHHNWKPYFSPNNGTIDMQAVLMHELGHCHGLDDSSKGARDGMNPLYSWNRQRFAPSVSDRSRVIAQQGTFTGFRFHAHRSTDNGASWSPISTNATSLSSLSTTIEPDAIRDASKSVLFYTSTGKKPCWIVGTSNTIFDASQWACFGGEDSFYGQAADGEDGEYMWAWVDPHNDDRVIRVVRTTNGGSSWAVRDPPSSSTSMGTPSIWHVSGDTWVLAYAKMDWANKMNTGKIVLRVSTNDGSTWSNEIVLNDGYRATSGVSVAGDGDEIRVAFPWANPSDGWPDAVLAFEASVSGGAVAYDGLISTNQRTRIRSILKANSQSYHSARVDLTNPENLVTARLDFAGFVFSPDVDTAEDTATTPAFAADKNLPWMFLYFLQ